MEKDKLITCRRCGSNACYEQQIDEEVTTWLCWGCGFTSSTLMTKNSSTVNKALESSPELYKDLMYQDKEGYIWLPSTISLPNQGMVFVDGTTKEHWKWAAVKAIPLEPGDKKVSENQTHKMDMNNVKHFKQKDFMEAADYINMFSVQ